MVVRVCRANGYGREQSQYPIKHNTPLVLRLGHLRPTMTTMGSC